MEWETFFYCITSLSVTDHGGWPRFEPFVWEFWISNVPPVVEENNAMQVVISSLFWGL